MRYRWTAMMAVLALVLVACAGGGSATQVTGGPDSSATTDVGASGEPETLAEFFGWETGDDPAAAQARALEQEARVQELIRSCMVGQGFEYIPVQQPTGSFDFTFDQEEFARERGFGITTWFGNEEAFSGPEQEWVDPNQEMIEAMSDSERDAYFEALYGPPDQGTPEIDEETGATYYVSEGFGRGCQGQAAEEVYGEQAGERLWEEFQPELEAMYEKLRSDPRIVAANEGWSVCMADRGYEFESRDDMFQSVYEDFQRRLDEIVGPNGGYGDPFADWTQAEIEAFFEEKTPEEVDAFFQQAQEEARQNVDQEALAALQQDEIDMAVAALECGSDMNELYREVTEEYEAEFIAKNRDELDALRSGDG